MVLLQYIEFLIDGILYISRTRPTPSLAATENKQKVLECEYGLSEAERYKKEVYSRQMSCGSTASSSYRSCSTSASERPTSASTVFTTPDDEEMPVLIDQVSKANCILTLSYCLVKILWGTSS